MSASALHGESRPSEKRVVKNVIKFHLSRSTAPNSQSITRYDSHAAVCLREEATMKSALIRSRTLSILLSMNGESVSLPMFALRHYGPTFRAIFL